MEGKRVENRLASLNGVLLTTLPVWVGMTMSTIHRNSSLET